MGTKTTISIPVPNHRELAIGTLGNIIRRSGLPREMFEVYRIGELTIATIF